MILPSGPEPGAWHPAQHGISARTISSPQPVLVRLLDAQADLPHRAGALHPSPARTVGS